MSAFAILCPGQGPQTPQLFSQFPFGARGLAVKEQVLASGALEPAVAAWISNPEGSPESIYESRFSQPLICLFQAMVWAELADQLPRPQLVAGYSLGELSAYGCAAVFTPEEIVRLATVRARAMTNAAPPGAMFAVTGLPPARVDAAIRGIGGHVAIHISESHCIVGCLAASAAAIASAVTGAGASRVTRLHVPIASHTSILDAAAEPFLAALRPLAPRAFRMPVLAGMNGSKVLRPGQILETLPAQMHVPLRWDLVMQRLAESGCRVFLELGPGAELSHMMLARDHTVAARSAVEFRSVEGVVNWVARSSQEN